MNMNKLFLPIGAESYIKEEFKEKVNINLHNENTIMVQFQEAVTGEDLINLFFTGAKWSLYLNETNKPLL